MPISTKYTRRNLEARLARSNFSDYIRYVRPEYDFQPFHGILARKLQAFAKGEIKRLMVFMPPQHGKSEQSSRLLPSWIHGIEPDKRIIATSYGAELASSFNRDVQRIMDSDAYLEVFPATRLWGENVRAVSQSAYLRNSDVFEIVGRKGGYRSAGVDGAVTGMPADFLLIDDPYKNYREACSPTIRKRVKDFYTSVLWTRQQKDSGILIMQTRWHEQDLCGWLLEEQNKGGEFADVWETLSFPAMLEHESERHPEDKRKLNEPLWPTKYDERHLRVTKRTLGSVQWSALYQQSPKPAEGVLIKAEWLRHYKVMPTHFDEQIQSWDMSFGSQSVDASFVVGSVYGRIGARILLLAQVRGQWDFPESIAQIGQLSKRFPKATRKLVERKANGQAVIDTLKKKIQGLIPINPLGSKESRMAAVSPLYEAGNVEYPDESLAPWIRDHEDEILTFPNARTDDRVDTETQALNYFRRSGIGEFSEGMSDSETSELNASGLEW